MTTEPTVIAQLDALIAQPFDAVMVDLSKLRAIREKVAALVEAAMLFDRMPNKSVRDNELLVCDHKAGEYRALSTALKGIGP